MKSMNTTGTTAGPPAQSAWASPPTGSSSQSASARKGSAPWKARPAQSMGTAWGSAGRHGGPASPPLEDAFCALNGAQNIINHACVRSA